MTWANAKRCSAVAKSTGLLCKNPALANEDGLCRSHARSTGPRTSEGKLRVAARQWQHGKRSKPALVEKAASAAVAKALQEILTAEMSGKPLTEEMLKRYAVTMEKWKQARAERLAFDAKIGAPG